jgi:hypothetical protein
LHGRQTVLRKKHPQNRFAILRIRFHGLQKSRGQPRDFSGLSATVPHAPRGSAAPSLRAKFFPRLNGSLFFQQKR